MGEKRDLRTVIADVKTAHDIVDVVIGSGSSLKQAGAHKFKGLCPFHQEKTPSFVVDTSFQNYYCFGCKEKGDVITFVQQTENLSFIDALKYLAEQRGIQINFDTDENSVDYATLRKIVRETAKFFVAHFKKLDGNHPAVKEITSRGLSPKRMQYGYAPEKRDALYQYLRKKGFSNELIVEAGVCNKSKNRDAYFDFWSGRLMFIITDPNGNPVGFSGRKLLEEDKRGKYVNSSDGPLFDKSKALFNIYSARKIAGKEKLLYVVEGQFDVAAFREASLLNVVASSGTSFSSLQAQTCQRLVSESGEVIFCFDSDAAGVDAAIRVFKENPLIHTSAKVVLLPEGLDPCDFRMDNGDEALRSFVNANTKNLVDFAIDSIALKYDLSSNVERSKYVSHAVSLIGCVKNRTLFEDQARKVALNSLTSFDEIVKLAKEQAHNKKNKNTRHSSSTSTSVDKTHEKDYLESTDDESDLISNIEDDELLYTAGAFLALSLDNRSFTKAALRVQKVIPQEYGTFLNDLYKVHQQHSSLIPENFKQVHLAKTIMDTRYWFPKIDEMERNDKINLLKHLKNTIDKNNVSLHESQVQQKINEILQSSQGSSTDRLMQALQIEERELKGS